MGHMGKALTPRAYTAQKYRMAITISGVRRSIDEKGRERCDFWGRSTDHKGHIRNTPCVVIGQNFDRIRNLIAPGAIIHATGVYETAAPQPGKAKAFHLIWASANSSTSANASRPATIHDAVDLSR